MLPIANQYVDFNALNPDLINEIFEQSLGEEILKQKPAPLPDEGSKYLSEFKKIYEVFSRVSKKWWDCSSILRAKFINANSFELSCCGFKNLSSFVSFSEKKGGKLLKILDLGGIDLPLEHIHAIINAYSHVESLYLNGSIDSFASIMLCKNLRYLSIEKGDMGSLDGIKNLTQLEELSLRSCKQLQNFSELSFLSNLKYLDLSEGCNEVCIKMPDLHELSKLTNLLLFETDCLTEHPEFLKDIVALKERNQALEIDIALGIKEALEECEDLKAYAKYFEA